jgi:hypothetical protein
VTIPTHEEVNTPKGERKPRRRRFTLFVVLLLVPAALCVIALLFADVIFRFAPREKTPAPPWINPHRTDTTLAAFMASRPKQPQVVFVECKKDNVYVRAYSNCASTHYSISLREWDNVFTSATAYAPKDSPAGRRLFEILQDGNGHKLCLKIAFQNPDGRPSKPSQEEVAILELVD